MSALDELITNIQKQGLEIKVYANNESVFGFGIYRNLDGCAAQVGYAVFDCTHADGFARFHIGGVGVIEYNTSQMNPLLAQRRFTNALFNLVGSG